MMEYFDLALEYLKEHKLITAIIAFLFFVLLIKNFWFLVKLLVALAIGVVVVFLILSFVGEATKKKKELLDEPKESSRLEYVIPKPARLRYPAKFSDALPPIHDPLS